MREYLVFLITNWYWTFSSILIGGVLSCYLYYRLTRRIYKIIDNKLYIKEGIGKWKEITKHISENHPEINLNDIIPKCKKDNEE